MAIDFLYVIIFFKVLQLRLYSLILPIIILSPDLFHKYMSLLVQTFVYIQLFYFHNYITGISVWFLCSPLPLEVRLTHDNYSSGEVYPFYCPNGRYSLLPGVSPWKYLTVFFTFVHIGVSKKGGGYASSSSCPPGQEPDLTFYI